MESDRERLAKRLFRAYWQESKDVASLSVIKDVVRQMSLEEPSDVMLNQASESLRQTTQQVVDWGAPGVPFFAVFASEQDKTPVASYFGQDRIILLELTLIQSIIVSDPLLCKEVYRMWERKQVQWDGVPRTLIFYLVMSLFWFHF